MSGSVNDLSFGVWPPAIDVSNAANQQIFNPQFSVANISAADTVSLTHATLLVPVTTSGTNLAQNTDMVPSANAGWTLDPGAPPSGTPPGYVAFVLLPNDDVGEIPPGGSVAFTLTGVRVNTAAGTAVPQLQARTSAGPWAPSCEIQLTPPSTTPTITRYSITPADPQTLTTLQNQAVTLSWTTSGAAYCVIEDDQLKKWNNLPTGGTLQIKPLVGNSPIEFDADAGYYYTRTFTLTAYTAGAVESDGRPYPISIQLPTIFNVSVTPASLAVGQQATATWSVANIDPTLGKITLSFTPSDDTGPYEIAILPSQTNDSGIVTPTPQTTTTYTLAVDNGYGVLASQLAPQTVTGSLPAGWQERHGLETLSVNSTQEGPSGPVGLVAFANDLWCWISNPAGLYRTSDSTRWAAVTTTPSLPSLDGLIVADLGDGEKLWAFGGGTPFLASSSDGITWDTRPTPTYPPRSFGNYVAAGGKLLVLGGVDSNQNAITDVWSTDDGRTWTRVGNGLPVTSKAQGLPLFVTGQGVASFAGALQTVADSNNVLWNYSSADGGKTWSQGTTAILPTFEFCPSLLPAGDVLVLFATNLFSVNAAVMDSRMVHFDRFCASDYRHPPVPSRLQRLRVAFGVARAWSKPAVLSLQPDRTGNYIHADTVHQ